MSGARGVMEAYRAQWEEHVTRTLARALKQTLNERPSDPIHRIGQLLLGVTASRPEAELKEDSIPAVETHPHSSKSSRSATEPPPKPLSLPKDEGATDNWSLVGWVQGTGVHRVIAAAVLRGAEEKGFGTDSDAALAFVRSLQDKSDLAVLFGTGPVADKLTETLWPDVLQVQAASAATTTEEIMGKFDGAIELSFYGLDKFFGGLGGIIGEPSNQVHTGMELEHLQGSESTEEFVTGWAAPPPRALLLSLSSVPVRTAITKSGPPLPLSGTSSSAPTRRRSSSSSPAGPRSRRRCCLTARNAASRGQSPI